MPNQKFEIRNLKSRYAFTLVEILLALAISAILLAAVAVAFNASVINYQQNENIFKAINGARQALFRITSQLRTADAVDPSAPSNECSMITAAGDDITYRFNSGDNTLMLITNDDLTDDDYTLCEGVSAMTFTKDTAVVDSVTLVKSVQMAITVTAGDTEKKLVAASVVRKNLE